MSMNRSLRHFVLAVDSVETVGGDVLYSVGRAFVQIVRGSVGQH